MLERLFGKSRREMLAERAQEPDQKEHPDPTPVEIPASFAVVPSLEERIRDMIRAEVSQVAQSKEFESFEEANDFEVDDEEDVPLTDYQVSVMLEEYEQEHGSFALEDEPEFKASVEEPNEIPKPSEEVAEIEEGLVKPAEG